MLCLSTDMESERFAQALARLAAAIDRLEKVATTPPPDARLAILEQRHRQLREGASEALARLDLLIASHRRPDAPPPPEEI